MGFDDILLAAHTVPALTTLRMPIAEIVGEGVELAIALARDPEASREPRRHGLRSDPRRAPIDGATVSPGDDPRPSPPDRDRRSAPSIPSPSSSTATDADAAGSRSASPGPFGWPTTRYGTAPISTGAGRLAATPERRGRRPRGRGRAERSGPVVAAGSSSTSSRSRPVRQVGRLDAVHERSAFERDAPAGRVDVRVGRRHADRQVQHQRDRVAAPPDAPVVDPAGAGSERHGIARRILRRSPSDTSRAPASTGSTASRALRGRSPRTRPSHG